MNAREFKRFLLIARGSNSELQTQLELSGTLGFSSSKSLKPAQDISHEVEKMLMALLTRLKERYG
jgi:four helix bundle protein